MFLTEGIFWAGFLTGFIISFIVLKIYIKWYLKNAGKHIENYFKKKEEKAKSQ